MLIVGAGCDLEAPTPEQMATLLLQIGERVQGACTDRSSFEGGRLVFRVEAHRAGRLLRPEP